MVGSIRLALLQTKLGNPESSGYSPLAGRTLYVVRLVVFGATAWKLG